MHIPPRNEGGVQRGIVAITGLLDILIRDGEHTGLTIAVDRPTNQLLDNLF